MTTYEIACDCYRKSKGNMDVFVALLEARGYREGFNGYEVCGKTDVRVYIGAPNRYAGFGFKNNGD